jgi:hypothetical protein
MTDEHETPTSYPPKPSALPASPEASEENTVPSDGYGNGHAAGAWDNTQTIRNTRTPPADHPQGHPPKNGEPDQALAKSNAGSAGDAGSLSRPNGGFAKRLTDAEASRVCAQCGAGRPGDLPTIEVTDKNGRTGYVHEHGCLPVWKKNNAAGTHS